MSLIAKFKKAEQIAVSEFSSRVDPDKMTLRQYTLLNAIRTLTVDGHRPSQMHLSEVTGIDRSTLANMVGRMINKNLIERARSKADGRAYMVSLAPGGIAAIEEYRVPYEKAEARLRQRISDEQCAVLNAILDTITSKKTPETVDA